jgi:hypothetical protein
MSVSRKLAAVENAAKRKGVGTCRHCYGLPLVLKEETWEPDPDGCGFRLKDWRLSLESQQRVTDDYHCRWCGAKAPKVVVLENLAGGT